MFRSEGPNSPQTGLDSGFFRVSAQCRDSAGQCRGSGDFEADHSTVGRRASHGNHGCRDCDERQSGLLEIPGTGLDCGGAYVLRSSRTDLDLEALARTYSRLNEIESTFRVMKLDLGLRPIYHSEDERIEGHQFITVLTYHTAHLVRVKLKQDGVHES